jgi:hypothetical protein
MTTQFKLTFTYDIEYKPSDTLYFGINLLLGCREFPLRRNTPSDDFSPLSSPTFNFNNATPQSIEFLNSSIIDSVGIDNVKLDTLFSDGNLNQLSFKVGSVALKQIVEFKSTGSLNDFFKAQFTKISDIKLEILIDSEPLIKLKGIPAELKLGKQYGEILLLQWDG